MRKEVWREIALAPLAVGCFSFGAGGGWCPCWKYTFW